MFGIVVAISAENRDSTADFVPRALAKFLAQAKPNCQRRDCNFETLTRL